MKKLIFLFLFYISVANSYVATYKNISNQPLKFKIYSALCPSLKFSKLVYLKAGDSIDVELPFNCKTQAIVDLKWPENKHLGIKNFWPFDPKSLSKNYITKNNKPIFFYII